MTVKVHEWIDGLDEWMDAWTDGWIDEWMDGWIDEWRIGGWTWNYVNKW